MSSNITCDTFTVLNYQGSKKNLLNFIYSNIIDYIDPNKALFDIFCGTCSVGYAFKRNFRIFANDSENYASKIAEALLTNNISKSFNKELFESNIKFNLLKLSKIFEIYLSNENEFTEHKEIEKLNELYIKYPLIWENEQFYIANGVKSIKDLRNNKTKYPFMLFSSYYAGSYFGIRQCMEIDSVRYAIDCYNDESLKSVLFMALYYAMKESVFSKDGHMAQPLDAINNGMRLLKLRRKSVIDSFNQKVSEFFSDTFINSSFENKIFNEDFKKVIKSELTKDVGFIYADPPYTDMQYSRYYHLLNTVTDYNYPELSMLRNGYISKGLYPNGRFQSNLSKKKTALKELSLLLNYCKMNRINLGLSYAYPRSIDTQPTDRYTMSINNIINEAKIAFGSNNVIVNIEEYNHSNNRNNLPKKVNEYLIVCKY